MAKLYKHIYLLVIYEKDDETLVGVFDNAQEISKYFGTTSHKVQFKLTTALKTTHNLHFNKKTYKVYTVPDKEIDND